MSHLVKRKELNLTEGPILSRILLFAFPLILTNILQAFYNAADMMIVSLSHEANAVGAIGTTSALSAMIRTTFMGFSMGTNVLVARHLGAKNAEESERTVHTSVLMSILFGTLGALIGILVSRPVLTLLGNQGNLLELSILYFRIYCCGIPFVAITNFCISILRAKGDSNTPLVVLSIAGVLNVGLNTLFVLGVGLSVEGVALATSLSNVFSAVVLLITLMRDKGMCHLDLKKLRIDKRSFRSIIRIGLPAGLQAALFDLSNMLIQSSIISVNNGLGLPSNGYQPIVDGNAAVANLETFIHTAVNAVSCATLTLVSQNLGANKPRRIARTFALSYLVSATVAIFMSSLLFFFKAPLLSLYSVTPGVEGSLEAIAFQAAGTRILIVSLSYVFVSAMEVGSFTLRGLGRSLTSAIICLLCTCLLRIVWLATVFRSFGTLGSIYISYPVSWLLCAVVLFIVSFRILRGMLKSTEGEPLPKTE